MQKLDKLPLIGKHKWTNENGRMLMEFSIQRQLVVRSTQFEHKDVDKET